MENQLPRKGFRVPPAPTKGQIAERNAELEQELKPQVEQLKMQVQFMGNAVSQLMNAVRGQLSPEVDALSSLEASQVVSADTPAQLGDHVMIDYIGVTLKDDGTPETDENGLVKFQQNLYGLKFTVRNLGSGSLIPGFEENIVGKKAGDVFEIDTQFPENYQAKDLASKKAKFTIQVHRVYRPFAPSQPEMMLAGYLAERNRIAREKAQAEEAAKAAETDNKGPGADSVPNETPATETTQG